MSISGISSDSTVYQNYASNQAGQIRKDFETLKTSLTSGDLSGAQAAYKTLTQDMQTAGQNNQTGPNSQFNTDLTAVGQALDSNDLSGAQKALATLQQNMQARHVHGHHHHKNTSESSDSTSNPLADLALVGNALQSNDLAGAQKAFQSLMQGLGTDTCGQNRTSTSDLASLSNALQANDLTGAQKAFQSIIENLQKTLTTNGGAIIDTTA